jgi:hypothetical protein
LASTVGIFAGTVFSSTAQTVSQAVNSTLTPDWVGVVLSVSAVSGSNPSVVFRLQWSMDGATWADADPGDSFTPIVAPTNVAKRFTVKAPYWRAVVDVSGSGATFTGTANAYI